MTMACDRKTLLLVSCYADGEATREEAARALEHLNKCPACRKMVSEWEEHRQVLDWAYTLELPEITFDLERQSMKSTTLETRPRPWRIAWRPKWAVSFALAAVVVAVVLIRMAIVPPELGARLATGAGARNVRMDGPVQLKVGPNSIVTRISDRAIKLERGWVEASVRHGTGFEIISKRLKVTDQGTKFRVDTGARGDVVTVDEGSVDASIGTKSHRVSAGQAFLALDGQQAELLSLPAKAGDEGSSDKGTAISERDTKFTPKSSEDLDFDEGIRELAARFPDLRLGGGGGNAWSLDKGFIGYYAEEPLVGWRDGLREHFGDIARALAGGEPEGSWEIPISVIQVRGIVDTVALPADTYYVRLALTQGRLIWKLTGARGDSAEMPVLLEKSGASDGGTSAFSREYQSELHLESTGAAVDQSGWKIAWRLLNWPGRLKPTARFTFRTVPISQLNPEKTSALSDLARQVAGVAGLEVENGVTGLGGNLIYLDARRTHWVFQIRNRKAAEAFSQARKLEASGNPARAAVWAINMGVPLGDPALPRGVYVVWWVLPGGHGKPYIEISTPDDKRRVRLPEVEARDSFNCIDNIGDITLRYGISEARDDPSNYVFCFGLDSGRSRQDKPDLGSGRIKIPKP